MRSIPCTFGANRSMTSLAIVLSVMDAFINNSTVAVVNIEGRWWLSLISLMIGKLTKQCMSDHTFHG